MRGTEPPQIGNPENPQSWSYTDILSAFMGLQPESAWSFSRVWAQCGSQWTAAVEDFAVALKIAKDTSWSGPASEQAMHALGRYTTDARKLSDDFAVMEQRISGTADSIARTRSSLPVTTVLDILEEDPEDRDAARAAMQNYYVTGFLAEDAGIPVLSRAQSPLSGSATIAGANSLPAADHSTGMSGTGTDADRTATSTDDPANGISATDSTSTDSASTDTGLASSDLSRETTSNSATHSASDSADRQATTAASRLGGPVATNALSANPSHDQSGPNGTYIGAPRVSNERKRSEKEPSSNVPLAALPLAAAPLAALATPSATPTRPTMPMMPAMANAAQRASDDDTEHKIPEYLITNDNGNELVGPIPKSIPPVLGA